MSIYNFDICKNCSKNIDFRKHKRAFQCGGDKGGLFSWCSRKCEREYYNKIKGVKE